jgi:colanic acid biosynthesis glycosyl transferase WcaI
VPFPEALPASDHPVVREIRGRFRFVLVHAGNLGFYGAWETLIQRRATARTRRRRFGVHRRRSHEGQSRSVGAGMPERPLPAVSPGEEVPYVMAAGDLHVVTVKRGLEGVVVPSKVYTILAAGRPLLSGGHR